MLRPRFSLRTLAILVTLVCAYFGAWEATKRSTTQYEKSPAPFIVVRTIVSFPLYPQRTGYYLSLGTQKIKLFEVWGYD
jgi:hypothetical protein